MRSAIHLLCCSALATSCGFSSASSDGEVAALSAMEQALTAAVQGAPYAALIQNTGTQVQPLPDEDPADDYAPQRWSITARVLETYRGPRQNTVQYTVDTELGEEPGLGDAPFIIVLCPSAEGYYWPGIGYNFPDGEREKALAKGAADKAEVGQKVFAECAP